MSAPNGEDAVAVCIVTYNSADDLPDCLEAVAAQEYRPLEIVIADCDSQDDSVQVARDTVARLFEGSEVPSHVVPLGENRGFAGGMNAAFKLTTAPYLLTLNADVHLEPDYLYRLMQHAHSERVGANPHVGAVTGRLRRPPEADGTVRLDACGMHWNRHWRHLDRGSGEVDHGQYGTPEAVVAGTGAATLLVRRALDDVAIRGHGGDHASEHFAETFHSYREDAELGLRLAGRGWRTVYEPAAVATHRRTVGSGQRRGIAPAINRSSLKNRYLLRIFHQRRGNFWRTLPWTLSRDVLALGWVLLAEHASLGAYGWLRRHWRQCWRTRRCIQRRVTHPEAVERWFRQSSEPL